MLQVASKKIMSLANSGAITEPLNVVKRTWSPPASRNVEVANDVWSSHSPPVAYLQFVASGFEFLVEAE